MSENPSTEHRSFIKTPKQLVIVVLLAHLIPITLIIVLTQLVMKSTSINKNDPAFSEEAIARRLKPVGEVTITAASTPSGEKPGKEVVDGVCAACHATGALNAPKIGDKAAWAPRIKEGFEALTKAAIGGIRQMPPRGGNSSLSDVEVARAVAYMANQAGADFNEPAGKPAAQTAAAPTALAAPAGAAPSAPQKMAAPAAAAGADKGKAVYESTCVVCHGTGVAGAPKAGDKAAWAPRLKQGMDALYHSALTGKNAMPPKGGNNALSDADVKAAVAYLTSLAK
jgi:cytochrome c5